MPVVEAKDFGALNDNKPFFDQPIKTNKKRKKTKNAEMTRNDDYTTGNSLDYSYHQNYYKPIEIDLSGQTKTAVSQQINFVEEFKEDDGSTVFFIA